jgi:predicted alpha-1,6-mannanase (GH76 family)
LLGYRDSWTFDLVIDPDGQHGAPSAVSTGVCMSARERAALGVARMLEWYDSQRGAFSGTNFWQNASMLETLLDYMRETGDSTAMASLATTFDEQGHGAFLSESYVDEAFWGLTWLKAYEVTRRQRYLDVARALFGDTTAGYGDKCGGGLYWDKQRSAKLTTTNALMMKLAARLAMHTSNGSDRAAFLSWANGAWVFLQNSGLLDDEQQVHDSLTNSCEPTGPIYTHNQGLVVGGLVEMWRATENDALLDRADQIAQAVLAKLTNAQGVLLEVACDPDCGEELSLYKGIFARNLAELQAVRPRLAYQTFLIKQADALWALSQNGEHQFGKSWQGPFDAPAAMRQAAAVDALVGAVRGSLSNVALLAHASGNTPCIPFESAERAIDGSSRLDSKWCSMGNGGQALDVDFGTVRRIVGFRVRHAGAAGEDAGWNTRDFAIETSLNGQAWQTVVDVVDNVDSVTTHHVLPFDARFARLSIRRPQSREDAQAARIYDFEVLAVTRP